MAMRVMHSDGEQEQAFRDAGGEGSIVFDPGRVRQASPALFDPHAYGDGAHPVRGAGGRGAAWFVDGEFGAGVLRHYRRGGWAARASRDGYLWQGKTRVRSLREFALLQQLLVLGLPVPAPIAAFYLRRGWRYRAAILVERIVGASSLVQAVNAGDAPWVDVGIAIARCHRQRAHHADLNANNILLDRERQPWLIDWDRGRIEPAAGAWTVRVLDRLQRSLLKECATVPATRLEEGMAQLRAAHARELGT
jgi:3-deoxy-D-manno-octulosonic acid kinase